MYFSNALFFKRKMIRKRFLSLRLQLTPRESLMAGQLIANQILKHPAFCAHMPRVGIYASIRGEPDLWCFPLMFPKTQFFLPVLKGKTNPAIHFTPLSGSLLCYDRFHILHPDFTDIIDNQIPHLIFVPLLAFDEKGTRLGYGKGCYDTWIASIPRDKRPILIGVAYPFQKTSHLEMHPGESPLDGVILPNTFISCTAKTARWV